MRWISRSPRTPARGRAGRRRGRGFGRRIVFSSFGAILLALELLVNDTEGLTAPNSWFSTAACLCLALVGWMPTLGGLLYTAVMVASAGMPGELVPLALPSLGIYAVCGEWVSRRRYVPAALALLAVEGARLATSPSPEAEAAGMVLACSVAVPIGLGVQWSERRTSDLERRAALAERHASEARAAVHRGLARELHDTAVRDLARIIMASQSIAQRSADPGVAQEAERLTELAAHAMRSIRSLMTGDEEAAAEEAPTPPPPPRNLAEIAEESRQMLSSRRIRLDCDLPASIDAQFPDRTRAVVGLAVQEGAANILRHARESTTASLLIERLPGGDAGLTMTNIIAADAPDTHNALSGGYGLADLTKVVADAGGTVLYGAADAMWRLVVTVPVLRGTGPRPAAPGGAPGDPR